MNTKIHETKAFDDQLDLAQALEDFDEISRKVSGEDFVIMNVKDTKGEIFNKASLEIETLSDGSIVYNIILSE